MIFPNKIHRLMFIIGLHLIFVIFMAKYNEKDNKGNAKWSRVDPIIQKVINLQLYFMASMKSFSHRTFIKGSSMKLNFQKKFKHIMKRREKYVSKN